MDHLDSLIHLLSRLPGIGKKSATRMAYYLLQSDEEFTRNLGEHIVSLKEKISRCRRCGNYSEHELCPVCADTRRDAGLICVVEQPQDIAVLEASHEYTGYYHVLHGVLAPLDGVGPSELNIQSLIGRVGQGSVRELIIATNPTVEGDTTALYLKKLVEHLGVTVSRLALGLPVGGDLEYADRLTLARSLKGRTAL
ncbi:recombination mediator RecR [Salinispira pacifica]|uniref:Recombination protein RecR n=1 Tax=Salinispira pacifica TaxID=1307761 RepID=V5WMF5_9SPIO|nr:recombination mediator RecR [Salinispira pacifica]AHC16833.1 Recombination protein RecR [Salinispira pacifica]